MTLPNRIKTPFSGRIKGRITLVRGPMDNFIEERTVPIPVPRRTKALKNGKKRNNFNAYQWYGF